MQTRVNQTTPLKYSPYSGAPAMFRLTANDFRKANGGKWLINPWTGDHRYPEDIESDPCGLLIVPPGEGVAAAREALYDAAETTPETVGTRGAPPADHPLQDVFAAAVEQATRGKGVRHGGDATPFLDQPWVHYGKMHGRGFLTGQAAKKLEEAASTRKGEAFIAEALGALVYIGMAILKEREDESL